MTHDPFLNHHFHLEHVDRGFLTDDEIRRIMEIPQMIITKYEGKTKDGRLLPVLSNQKINAYLKEIADLCGIKKRLSYHLASHSKFFYLLNISELSFLKNVTANDLETSYILFLSQLCNIQRTL